MQWLSTCLVICAWITLPSSATTVADLRCSHPQCVGDGIADAPSQIYRIEGHKIVINNYEDGKPFFMFCDDLWQALDSPALPSFSSSISVTHIELQSCPLPTTRSLVDALAAMNVTLNNADRITLELANLPAEPQIIPRHFQGFENVYNLWMKGKSFDDPLTKEIITNPDLSFLPNLQNLHYLNMAGVPLPANVKLPPTLHWFHLGSTTVRPLSDMLRQTSSVKSLTFDNNELLPSNAVSNGTGVQEIKPSKLKFLILVAWKEQRLEPFERCENLKTIELLEPRVEELPNGWIAACPQLENIEIRGAEDLLSLPPKLLEGANALKILSIKGLLQIQTLPDGFFAGAPNLIELDLSSNKLKTISSAVFVGPALQILRIGQNELNNLEGIASLTSLKVLSVDHNPLGDLCDHDGYSVIKNLNQLKELNLRAVNITHICRDWRENMTFLKDLYLEMTQITELGFTDLIYTRDASVKNVSLKLFNTPFKIVRLTEDDYKKAIANPPKTTVLLRTHVLKCDCEMFWTWKALVNVSSPWLELNCLNNLPLHTRSAMDICPGRS